MAVPKMLTNVWYSIKMRIFSDDFYLLLPIQLSLSASLFHFFDRFCRMVNGFFSLLSLQLLLFLPSRQRQLSLIFNLKCDSEKVLPLRARKSDNYIYNDSWKINYYSKGDKGKKQRNYTKYEAKTIRSDNFTRSNREKSIIGMNKMFNCMAP